MYSDRQNALRGRIQMGSGGACLINAPSNIRWLTGFTGSSGSVLVTQSEVHVFTDGRYTEQISAETTGCEVHIGAGAPLQLARSWAQERRINLIHLGYKNISFSEGLTHFSNPTEFESSDLGSTFEELRAVKNDVEVSSIREALRITERVLSEVLSSVRQGVTEKEIAAEIDYKQRLFGAEKSSFETIVAFGVHSSFPHARPTDKKLLPNTPILMDFGCVIDGYASDMTRMAFLGVPDHSFLTTYARVKEALSRAERKACAGISGKELDLEARSYFKSVGVDGLFIHSLGHGVGLDIHEWPSISSRNELPLPSECIITLEPGLYLPKQFGIRIENMVQLAADGCDVLNTLSTELIVI